VRSDRSRRPLLALLLALLMLLGCAQNPTPPGRAPEQAPEAGGPSTPARPVFELHITAPQDVHALLQQHLELGRWQHQADLQPRELRRLLGGVEANVRDLLGTQGYFAPSVQVHVQQMPDTAGAAGAPTRITLTVAPGQPTHIASSQVHFVGPGGSESGGSGLRASIRQHWPLQVGQRFTQEQWGQAKTWGLRSLQEKRYPLARLHASHADIDADRQQADVSVHYAPGAAVHFGPLHVENLQAAPLRYDSVGVARIARLPQGQEYAQTQLLQAQQRLAASGYYDTVFLTLAAHGQDSASDVEAITLPVIAQVREAPLQKWVFGVGVSTDTGARLSTDHTHNRLPLVGWRAQTRLHVERQNPLLATEWTALPDPDLWRWFTAAKVQSEPAGDFDINSLQWRVGRSKSAERIERNHYLQYNWARAHGSGAPPSSSAISGHYGWSGRYFDSMLSPSAGFGFALELGAGSTLMPQRSAFGRVFGRWLALLPLGAAPAPEAGHRAGRLALRATGGAVLARTNTPIPVTQLFTTGGDSSVRGYGYQSIGVRNASARVQGGRYLATGSIEWQRPITLRGNAQDWEQTLFIDAGTVGNAPDALNLRIGVGTGLRWRSPVGPVQADIAWGAQTRQLRLHLRLGFGF